MLFSVWEDAGVWAHWNHSFHRHLSIWGQHPVLSLSAHCREWLQPDGCWIAGIVLLPGCPGDLKSSDDLWHPCLLIWQEMLHFWTLSLNFRATDIGTYPSSLNPTSLCTHTLSPPLESIMFNRSPTHIKEISPEYSLEGLMLKLKLQYFGHLMQRTDSLKKTLMPGKIESGRTRGRQRMRWLDGSMDMSLSKLRELVVGPGNGKPGVLQSMGSQRVRQDWVTELNWTNFCWMNEWCHQQE